MPATEETYRSQPTLHIVFALTSIAMTISIIWMIMADHLRPWKQVQREFHEVERAKLKAAEQESLEKQQKENQAKIEQIDNQIKQAEQEAAQRAADLRRLDREINCTAGEDREARHPAEVQEGRARQPAQPLRRHDRARRGAPGQAVPEHDGRRRREGAQDPLARARGVASPAQGKGSRQGEAPGLRRQPGQGAGEADSRDRPGEAAARPEGGPVLRPSRLAPRAARNRHGGPAHQDPADQPARPDDQLQLQGRSPLRPVHDLPPGHRPPGIRQGPRAASRCPRSSPRTRS